MRFTLRQSQKTDAQREAAMSTHPADASMSARRTYAMCSSVFISFGFISLFGLGVCAIVFHATVEECVHILFKTTGFELRLSIDAAGVHIVAPQLEMRCDVAEVARVTGWAQRDVAVGDHDLVVWLRLY